MPAKRKPPTKRKPAKREPAKRRRKPIEGWVTVELLTDRWFIASKGLAENRTNPLAKPSTILQTCEPVTVIPVGDDAALAAAIEAHVIAPLQTLPPILAWKHPLAKTTPGPVETAAGFPNHPQMFAAGLRAFSVDIEAKETRVTEALVKAFGHSITADDPFTTLPGAVDYAKIAATLHTLSKTRRRRR